MAKIDLITGFLGSGKTTFIKRYAEFLIKKGLRIGILENDFGAVNVDMMLLQRLMGDQCELEMIAGGCDRETHARRFRTKLIAMGMCGYDRVLVEPSGIYDVDEFFDVLREEPLDQWYEVGSVITVVDAKLEEKLSEEAEYLLASEAACAGTILLSHADEASKDQIARTAAHLNRALLQIHCDRRLDREILAKGVPALTEEDFARLEECGYVQASYRKMDMRDYKGFDSLYFMNMPMSEDALRRAVAQMMEDEACGEVFRVKGFFKGADGGWRQLNATRREISVQPIDAGQEVLIVIGEKLEEESIKKWLERESGGNASPY